MNTYFMLSCFSIFLLSCRKQRGKILFGPWIFHQSDSCIPSRAVFYVMTIFSSINFDTKFSFLRESQNLSSGTLQLLELFDYWNSSISFTASWISSITLNIILATISITSDNLQTLLHQLRTLLDLE